MGPSATSSLQTRREHLNFFSHHLSTSLTFDLRDHGRTIVQHNALIIIQGIISLLTYRRVGKDDYLQILRAGKLQKWRYVFLVVVVPPSGRHLDVSFLFHFPLALGKLPASGFFIPRASRHTSFSSALHLHPNLHSYSIL